MRSRTWLWAGLLTLSGASCVAILDGEHPYKQGETTFTGAPCSTTANCDDDNPCTTDTCPTATLVCEYVVQADGLAPATSQIASDCKRIQCVGGQPIMEDDPQDFVNDNNSCTTDTCSGGMPTNQVLPDDSSCAQGDKMGTCVGGVCEVACSTNTQCDDNNPCSEEFCNTSTSRCTYNNLDGVPTPGSMSVTGDCKVQFCEGGFDKLLNDDGDIKNDDNPCTIDTCNAGTPVNTPVAERVLCVPGKPEVCTAAGACVECVVADDCVNIVETECEKRSCVNNTCQIAYQGTDTLASPVLQKPSDCKKVVCNGNMGTTNVNDDMDVPNDGNPCTKDVCANGMPSNPPEAQNLNCGGTQVCDGMGKCVGCTSAAQCPGMDDFCKTRTCMNNVCGLSFTADGTDLPMGQTAGDCKVLQCDGSGNVKTSVLTTDVPVDNNQCTNDVCNMMGAPSNPATPINSMCSANGNDACDGSGNCKKSLGKPCAGNTECVSTFCIDGVCCNNSCTATCQSCNVSGSVGTCSGVPKGQDDGMCTGASVSCNSDGTCDSENGQSCAGNSACLSGFCADNVCCNSACDTACKSCNITGSAGTCSNIPITLQDNNPASICAGTSQCDGMGNCKRNLGQSCASSAECITGFCADGVCCDSACTATCKSCNIAGALGTCSNVPMGVSDGTCNLYRSCDGAGSCKTMNGGPCGTGNECFSTFCVDTICCNTGCGGLCRSCNVPGSAGTCSNIAAGTDPDNDCAAQSTMTCGTNGFCDGTGGCQRYPSGTVCVLESCSGSTQTNADTCDGVGACVDRGTTSCAPYTCGATACKTACMTDTDCTSGNFCNNMTATCMPKKGIAVPCTGSNQCISGNCVDGICCGDVSCLICQSCLLGNGFCATLLPGQQDSFPAGACDGTMACNGGAGSNACRLANGQMCAGNSACASLKCVGGICVP